MLSMPSIALLGSLPASSIELAEALERCFQIASVKHHRLPSPIGQFECGSPYAEAIYQLLVNAGLKEETISEDAGSYSQVRFATQRKGRSARCLKTEYNARCEFRIEDTADNVSGLLDRLRSREAFASELGLDPKVRERLGAMPARLAPTPLAEQLKACIATSEVMLIAFGRPGTGIACKGQAAHSFVSRVLSKLPSGQLATQRTESGVMYSFGEVDPAYAGCLSGTWFADALCFFIVPSMDSDGLQAYLTALKAGRASLHGLPIDIGVRALLWQPSDPPADSAAEIEYWQSVKDSRNPDELSAYMTAFPTGRFLDLARMRLQTLQTQPPQ